MHDKTLQIPFSISGRPGALEVCYKENTGPEISGFDILGELVPDLNICIGYPTVQAYVKQYPGNGYYRYCGWIQVLRMEFYSDADKTEPEDVHYDADVLPSMKENRLPFFAYGYPAQLYDAPCNNFYDGAKLIWRADTFLVSMPSYINNNSISYLAGFRWGYTEHNIKGNKRTEIAPVETITEACWQEHLDMLSREFPNWSFA